MKERRKQNWAEEEVKLKCRPDETSANSLRSPEANSACQCAALSQNAGPLFLFPLIHQRQTSVGRTWPWERWLSAAKVDSERVDSWSSLMTTFPVSGQQGLPWRGGSGKHLCVCHTFLNLCYLTYSLFILFSKECELCVQSRSYPGRNQKPMFIRKGTLAGLKELFLTLIVLEASKSLGWLADTVVFYCYLNKLLHTYRLKQHIKLLFYISVSQSGTCALGLMKPGIKWSLWCEAWLVS